MASPKLLIPSPYSGPCPLCGYSQVMVRAKDENSSTRDWVTCGKDTCTYAASFNDFRAQWAADRKA